MPSRSIGVTNWNSRNKRRQIVLQKAACPCVSQQLKITEFYYPICQKISELAETHFDPKESLRMMTQNYQKLKEKDSKRDQTILFSVNVLTRMINECLQHESASSRSRRYKDVLLKFGMNLWILDGRKMYEIIYANFLGIFLCPRTIQVKLLEYDNSVAEGMFQNESFFMNFM
jgi:hypothetical protein